MGVWSRGQSWHQETLQAHKLQLISANSPAAPVGWSSGKVLPGLRPLLEVMDEIAARRRKTLSQVAINWCMCQGTVPIPGAKDLQQAKDNLGALGWRLSDGEVQALSAAADRVPRAMVQNVFQTR